MSAPFSAPFIITIDGPAGVGKSTLARRLAEALGVAYLDTGAMFRTLALHMAQRLGGAHFLEALPQGPALQSLLEECLFALQGAGAQTTLLCNGEPVGDAIRSEEAGMMASRIAKNPQVRDFLKQAQQGLGLRFSLVAEGRDMGTVVFPGALCKIFLDAVPEVRAERRFKQLQELGEAAALESLIRQIRERDHEDRNRPIAPLRPAVDAHIIDSSHHSIDQVFEAIMEAARQTGRDAPPSCPMRRKDRALSHEESQVLLERGKYGVLALAEAGPEAWPYGLPLSYVLMDGAVYFHSALEGRKVRVLAENPRVCFTVVGDAEAFYERNFTTSYESVMLFGHAVLVEDAEEKYRALFRLAEKYLPEHRDKAEGDIRQSLARTAVYRIFPEAVTGKAKRRKKGAKAL